MSNRNRRRKRREALRLETQAGLQREQERRALDRAYVEADAYANDKGGRTYAAVVESLYASAEEGSAS